MPEQESPPNEFEVADEWLNSLRQRLDVEGIEFFSRSHC
jgi:hypothetical protein